MSNKYLIKYSNNHCVEISKPNSSILAYKIPYREIKNKIIDMSITNRFIVYILTGKDKEGKDIIYVGKSKNGIDNRPVAHEGENKIWKTCYILTSLNEQSFLNDGTIQYIEDKLNQHIKQLDMYLNTTKVTNSNTIGNYEMECCDEYLDEIFNMLFILGLDLYIYDSDKNSDIKSEDIKTDDDIDTLYNNIVNSLSK